MVKVNNAAIGYNSLVIRDNLNYTFKKGMVYGIIGESGCGKTTLLKTIAGLLKPIKGSIETAVPVKDIYMMHQQYTCFDWLTCLDNILITEKVKHHRIDAQIVARAKQALNEVGLLTSLGYDKLYPTQLSGGQRQRLALARTLFTNPPVILMDEPLSALDVDKRREMQDLILKKHSETGNTIIMITHSVAEAHRMCNEIIHF